MPVSTKDMNIIFPLNSNFDASQLDDTLLRATGFRLGQLIGVAIRKLNVPELGGFTIIPKKKGGFTEASLKDHEHLKWMVASRENFLNTVKFFKSVLNELVDRKIINKDAAAVKRVRKAIREKFEAGGELEALVSNIQARKILGGLDVQENVHEYGTLLAIFEKEIAGQTLEDIAESLEFGKSEYSDMPYPPVLKAAHCDLQFSTDDPLQSYREVLAFAINQRKGKPTWTGREMPAWFSAKDGVYQVEQPGLGDDVLTDATSSKAEADANDANDAAAPEQRSISEIFSSLFGGTEQSAVASAGFFGRSTRSRANASAAAPKNDFKFNFA